MSPWSDFSNIMVHKESPGDSGIMRFLLHFLDSHSTCLERGTMNLPL